MTDHQHEQTPLPVEVEPKSKAGEGSNWALGLAILAIGGLLLARNLGFEIFLLQFHNWWAFFILLAAISPLQQAYQIFRTEGIDAAVLNRLISAASVVFIALVFLLDLSLKVWWPMFVILYGAYLMTGRNRV